MKKTLLLLSLSFGAASAFAQAYIPFPTDNVVWTQRYGNHERPVLECYSLSGVDEVIDGKTYHTLYKSDNVSLSGKIAVGKLREEDKRIYYTGEGTRTGAGTSGEILLYNFNLNPGEVFTSQLGFPMVLDYIDNVTIDGVVHRKFHFKDYPSESWIEGIGNSGSGGLLQSLSDMSTCDCNRDLLCVQQSGNWVFHNTTDCEGATLSIDDVQPTKANKISLYPNPVTDLSVIHVSGTDASQVAVYSMTGALVHLYQVVKGQDVTLGKADFATGIYSYRVTTTSGEALQKGLFEVRN